MNMPGLKTLYLLIPFLLLAATGTRGQTATEIKQAKKLFAGRWEEKQSKRHLSIFVENDGYVTINDWTGKQQDAIIDAYKAFIRQGKLVMPADVQHHAPYSEMQIKGNTLLYLTKMTDIHGKTWMEKLVFRRF